MAAFVTEAIVTSARRYGEADRLLTLLTLERGRLSAIAKSARKPKSSLRGATEPFVRARFELAEGRSLAIVRQAEILDARLGLRENWTRLQLAGHIAEIANKMGEEGIADRKLYQLVSDALAAIDEGRENAVLRFKVGLLDDLGVFPDLSGCAKCGRSRVSGDVHLDTSRGGFLCADCAGEAHVYHPVAMAMLQHLHSLRTEDRERPGGIAIELRETAEDVLTLFLQGFLQSGFKTASAARHARKTERERVNKAPLKDDNNSEPSER